MKVILDTHVLIWLIGDPKRISGHAMNAIGSADMLAVSAVTAFEFQDLAHRGRLPDVADLSRVTDRIDLAILPFPADAWRIVDRLPSIHRDPVDRMLIAHAVYEDFALVTADAKIRRYPVHTIW